MRAYVVCDQEKPAVRNMNEVLKLQAREKKKKNLRGKLCVINYVVWRTESGQTGVVTISSLLMHFLEVVESNFVLFCVLNCVGAYK